jgi:hypothetical protein
VCSPIELLIRWPVGGVSSLFSATPKSAFLRDILVALLGVAMTLAGTLAATILNATWLETRRQLIKRKIEEKALNDALCHHYD